MFECLFVEINLSAFFILVYANMCLCGRMYLFSVEKWSKLALIGYSEIYKIEWFLADLLKKMMNCVFSVSKKAGFLMFFLYFGVRRFFSSVFLLLRYEIHATSCHAKTKILVSTLWRLLQQTSFRLKIKVLSMDCKICVLQWQKWGSLHNIIRSSNYSNIKSDSSGTI